MSNLAKMSQEELITWIKGLDLGFKQKIITGIKEVSEEDAMTIEGKHFFNAEDKDDIKDLTNLKKHQAEELYNTIQIEKAKQFAPINPQPTPQQPGAAITFKLKIQGQKLYTIKGAQASWTICRVKEEFLKEVGNVSKALLYQQHAFKLANKDSQGKLAKDGIVMKHCSNTLADDATLQSLGIVSAMHMPLVTTFKVIGGAEEKHKDNEFPVDKFKTRKIRTKKYKDIKLSNKPDCIMGYTNEDGIKRAEMPCGCPFAADTMFRYFVSLFEKDLKAVKPVCPVPKNSCKGNDKQREWPWGLVFAVSDLTDKEEEFFTKAIENRLSGSKNCPHCGAVTEKPEKVEITRVRCTACSNSDWCWHCGKVWNHSGLGPICGNKGCMADQINEILKVENCGEVSIKQCGNWEVKDKDKLRPKTRACPKCLQALEWSSACKHIWCVTCPHQFCFNCLANWKLKGGEPYASNECNHGKICQMSPVQVFT